MMGLLGKLRAQEYKNGIGVHFAGIDFYGPQTGHYMLHDKLNKSESKMQKKFYWDPAIRISYWHAFNSHFDLNAGLNISALHYPLADKDSAYILAKEGMNALKNDFVYMSADVKANYTILPRSSSLLAPYITAGLSMAFSQTRRGMDIPAGIGVNINVGKGIYLNLESIYGIAVSKFNQPHLMHSFGLVYWWKSEKAPKKDVVITPTPVMVKDTDNDGIPDSEDVCPTMPGKKDMKGCPDRDNDGIADADDRCPDIKGKKEFAGCPDTDNDGIEDNQDNCPAVAGVEKYKGCPVPDTDQDGFNDEVDKCPEVASAVNNGCPEIKQEVKKNLELAAQGIFFETGSAVISKRSFVNLNKIVDILKSDATYRIDIEGHTDNVGKPESNMILSQKRADACRKYIADHGIPVERITSAGFGDTKPIGDNSTEIGRSQNRRTDFNIRNY